MTVMSLSVMVENRLEMIMYAVQFILMHMERKHLERLFRTPVMTV